MEGLQHRPRVNTTSRGSDMDELLSNGFWKTSRAKTQVPASSRPIYRPSSSPVIHDIRNVARPTRPRTTDWRNYKKPVCEDELKSLSKEINFAKTSRASLHDDEPPARGCIDQHPVLLEADLSAADILKYENQSREDEAWEQSKKEAKHDKNEEKRFVFIPTDKTYSPFNEAEPEKASKHLEPGAKSSPRREGSRDEEKRSEKSPRRSSRERRDSRERWETREKKYNRDHDRRKDSENVKSQTLNPNLPSLSRQRSRQDLPALKTQVHQESPPFNRSVSDFPVSSKSPERKRRETQRSQNGEYLLSPVSPVSGRSPSRGYFDSVPRRFPNTQGHPTSRKTLSEERDTDVHLLTPKSATFPQEKRSSSSENIRVGVIKPEGHVLKPKATANNIYYVSSDDESLTDDDDDEPVIPRQSEREYDQDREHHNHYNHHHHRNHSYNSKYLGINGNKDERHRRSPSRSKDASLDVKPISKFASPLPSPSASPTQTSFDYGSFDKKDGHRTSSFDIVKNLLAAGAAAYIADTAKSSYERPKSRHTSPSSESIKSPRSSTNSFHIPMPPRDDIRSSKEGLLSPILNESSRKAQSPRSPSSTRTPQPLDASGKPFWQPPSFYPEENLYPNPVGAYRRYSEDITRGQQIPDCSRIIPVAGKKDWLTLPGCASFDICSNCFNHTMGKTEFASQFIPSPKRPAEEEVFCSFGSYPWYRIAWILTLKEGRKDLRMFHDIEKIDTTVQPCLGPHHATRAWNSVYDPATHKPVEGFNVCPSCVRSIEAVLPPLKGIFIQKSTSAVQKTRKCDMHFGSSRFVKYFDMLENTADTAVSTFRPPNTASFVALAKKYAALDECPGKDEVHHNKKWHFIEGLPEFTVCPECYEEVVRPSRKKNHYIPMMFERTPRRVEGSEGAKCHLAAEKDKEWFKGTAERLREVSRFAKVVKERKRDEA